jgi:multidrug efflux pump subunit AcrA (membrane-fusion protein)
MNRWLLAGLLLAVGLPFGLVTAKDDRNADVTASGLIPVKVITMKAHGDAEAPHFSGRIEAGDSASLAFRVSGQIQALNIQMSQDVQKGDVLAELDPTDYLLNVEAKEAEFELARLGVRRASALFEKNTGQ